MILCVLFKLLNTIDRILPSSVTAKLTKKAAKTALVVHMFDANTISARGYTGHMRL